MSETAQKSEIISPDIVVFQNGDTKNMQVNYNDIFIQEDLWTVMFLSHLLLKGVLFHSLTFCLGHYQIPPSCLNNLVLNLYLMLKM